MGTRIQKWPRCDGVTIRGRRFTQSDIVQIRHLIRRHRTWTRTRLSEELCRLWSWLQPNGRIKDRACRVALIALEQSGFLALPPKKKDRGGRPPRIKATLSEQAVPITVMPSQLSLTMVESRPQRELWNELIATHHYLKLPSPVGRLIRYLIEGDGNVLGAISFTSPAWSVAARDQLIARLPSNSGVTSEHLVSNNRFLILPNVRVKNLASRVLAQANRSLSIDWVAKYGVPALVVETFVDPSRFTGACYRAANWLHIGQTRGFSKRGGTHTRHSQQKLIFVRGLRPLIHQQLLTASSAARGKPWNEAA